MYYIDDPLTPELVEEEVVPSVPSLPFLFQEEHNCKITLYRAVNYYQSIVDTPLSSWARKSPLLVIPHAGNQLNAYYNRRSLSFFDGQGVQTAASADVVAHELGHGLLDALRPDFWSVQSLEVWAFHEAWADITAIVTVLQSDAMIDYILKETAGDLRKSNLTSRIASQVGMVDYGRNYLRDAARKYGYVPPQQLPKAGPEDNLSAECHSFSRVFSSAWYEFFVRVYEIVGDVKKARDHAYKCLWKAARTTPLTVRFLSIVAKNFVAVDTYSVAEKVFREWKILRPEIKMLSTTTLDSFQTKPTDSISKNGDSTIVRRKPKTLFKLSDHVVTALASSPLADVKIEIPNESYFRFDAEGKLADEIVPTTEELVESSLACLAHIKTGRGQMWKIKNRKLERSRI